MARRPDVPMRNGTAGGFSGQPPRRTQAAGFSPPQSGLTPKFNKAAQGKVKQGKQVPVSAKQIEVLQKRLSRPAHTAEMTPTGNVVGSYDPARDRNIQNQIKAIQKKLSKNNDMAKKAFQKTVLKSTAKNSFNRASGRKM